MEGFTIPIHLRDLELPGGVVSEAAAALAEGEARGVAAPVRREPPSSHRAYPQTTASTHRMHALLVDDGPHGRRRPAIRPAAHAHER